MNSGDAFDQELLGYIKGDVAPVINIYDHVSAMGRPALVRLTANEAIAKASAELARPTGNPGIIRAWAAMAPLLEALPKVMRHGGLDLNARWQPRTMEDYLLEKKEQESWQ